MADALKRLRVPFVLAAGSSLDIVSDQFLAPLHAFGFRGTFDAFLCNGASRYRCACGDDLGIELIREFSIEQHLGAERFGLLKRLLAEILEDPRFRLPSSVSVIGDRIVDRGSMVNFAPIGRPYGGTLSDAARGNRDAFVAHDLQSGYRAALLAHLRTTLGPVAEGGDLVVTLGGQTSFDIVVPRVRQDVSGQAPPGQRLLGGLLLRRCAVRGRQRTRPSST